MAAVIAILLAAGESRRMGQLKALLPWQGTSLLKHQVASLRAGGVDRVVVVLGHRSDELKAELAGIEARADAAIEARREPGSVSTEAGE